MLRARVPGDAGEADSSHATGSASIAGSGDGCASKHSVCDQHEAFAQDSTVYGEYSSDGEGSYADQSNSSLSATIAKFDLPSAIEYGAGMATMFGPVSMRH